MRTAWILTTVLALSFSPALTQAREKAHRSGRDHSEQRSAKRDDSAGKRHSTAVSRHSAQSGRPSHAFHRAPRYRWTGRSTHLHPSFLPRYRHGYFWSAGYYYPRYYFDYNAYPQRASLRILAHPSEAEVYVDGYYAGIVDDFDGFFQRLHVSPGAHEITLRLDGFRTWSAEIYASPHSTVKVHCDLIPGVAAEPDLYEY